MYCAIACMRRGRGGTKCAPCCGHPCCLLPCLHARPSARWHAQPAPTSRLELCRLDLSTGNNVDPGSVVRSGGKVGPWTDLTGLAMCITDAMLSRAANVPSSRSAPFCLGVWRGAGVAAKDDAETAASGLLCCQRPAPPALPARLSAVPKLTAGCRHLLPPPPAGFRTSPTLYLMIQAQFEDVEELLQLRLFFPCLLGVPHEVRRPRGWAWTAWVHSLAA